MSYKEEMNLNLSADDIIVYIENLKEYRKMSKRV